MLVFGLLTLDAAAGSGTAPEFPQRASDHWINSVPLTMASLRGQVILLDVWTFGCWNCYRSFPWLNDLEQRLKDQPFQVIGIHSPEFDHEQDPELVHAKVREFGLHHPVMIDNDFAYWKALENRYWPAFYLIDKQGRMREHFIGETHSGDAQAKRIESAILRLLAESPD